MLYSITRQRGKCSRKYSKSSFEAPGQLVSSSSRMCRSWIKLESPLDVNMGHPVEKDLLKLHCVSLITLSLEAEGRGAEHCCYI